MTFAFTVPASTRVILLQSGAKTKAHLPWFVLVGVYAEPYPIA